MLSVVVQESLPTSFEIWQVYFPLFEISTEYRFKKPVDPSIPNKQLGPDTSSKSSLNHFILKGGVPFKVALNSTVESGTACWLSGLTRKLGGSKGVKKQTKKNCVFGARIIMRHNQQ